ncbi:hypothetical protein CR513_55789, partial [Mucuna pruriens]
LFIESRVNEAKERKVNPLYSEHRSRRIPHEPNQKKHLQGNSLSERDNSPNNFLHSKMAPLNYTHSLNEVLTSLNKYSHKKFKLCFDHSMRKLWTHLKSSDAKPSLDASAKYSLDASKVLWTLGLWTVHKSLDDGSFGRWPNLRKEVKVITLRSGKELKELKKIKKHEAPTKEKGFEMVNLTEECFIVVLKKLSPKLKGPRSFTFSYTMGNSYFGKTLCHLGASINLTSYSIFLRNLACKNLNLLTFLYNWPTRSSPIYLT